MSDPNYYGRLAADSFGADDERAPLLMLHGLSYDRRQWAPVLDQLRLIDDRRRVLALDLPGHGDSPWFETYAADEVVDAIHEAVVAARIGAPVVVGHSLGGALTTTYAGRYPVRGVVSVDQPLLAAGFGSILRGVESKLRGPDYHQVWESMLPGMRIDLLPPAARDLVRSGTTPRQDRTNATPYRYLSGDEVSPDYRSWLEVVLPEVTITVLAGSGHFPHLAHPAEFAKMLAG